MKSIGISSSLNVGPDEGDLKALKSFILKNGLQNVLTYEGPVPYSQVRTRLGRSSVYVLPSVNEPFPVTVLEAMAVGTPCVITDTCGLAPYFRDEGAGIVTDGTPESLATAVERLISDSDLRRSIVLNAYRVVDERFSIMAVVDSLERYYRQPVVRV